MQSTQKLIQLSRRSINLDDIKCIFWVRKWGVMIYIEDGNDDADEDNGGFNGVGLGNEDSTYEADFAILKAFVAESHLTHLTEISIDLRFIHRVAWDAPCGFTIYIGNQIKIGEWAGEYNAIGVHKGYLGYDSDRSRLRKLVEE